jgi:SAM-dependent methyltransferase
MANFPPFKRWILLSLEELIVRHRLADPFLDAGCGRGDVSQFLARRGWSGKAIDVSARAAEIAAAALAGHPSVRVARESVEAQRGDWFGTVLMLDMIEHVADDRAVLRAAAAVQQPGASLVLTVPSNPGREWRWDDDFYGHLRRYEPNGLSVLLQHSGYETVEMWDVSYPVFWALRRVFTAIKRAPRGAETAWERTQESPFVDAWAMGPLSALLAWRGLWGPVYALQRRYRRRPDLGHELMVLARRVAT